MKFISIIVLGFLFVWGFSEVQVEEHTNSSNDSTLLEPQTEHFRQSLLITGLLNQHHYRKVPLNDSLSSVIFDNYVEILDPNKEYFLQSDIDYFEKYRNSLDDDLKKGNLDVAYQIFRIYRERATRRLDYTFKILENEPDFNLEESMDFDRDNLIWKTSHDELDEFWRKKIKSYALNYKLRDKDWAYTQDLLVNRYKNFEKTISQYNSEDVFEYYMNAYTSALDPHTSYFSPVSSDRFQVNMSHSLEGIGARLVQDVDYTKIYELVPGGPAYKSQDIYKDDRIVGVAQGDDGEFEDVVGWRLDEVVKKIKGPKGTVVQLLLLRKGESFNAIPDTLRLVREKINLQEDDARAEIIPISQGNSVYNLGVITVPSFYINFEEAQKGLPDYKSVSRDVKKLIGELKEDGIDGLVIDLRNNGGGALQEAIDMTGLFIEDGPVVQVRKSNGTVEVEKDTDSNVYFDGPLAVLINRFSASASEIFAGAIQDYQRGIILGETSFGKGSVQNLVGLNQFLPSSDEELGQLKLTLAKYYRVSGSSTQNIGVVPDIEFPTPYAPDEFGESSEANALPWDKIAGSAFLPANGISKELIDQLKLLYVEDLKNDEDLRKLQERIEKAKEEGDNSVISLNYSVRKQEMDAQKEEDKDGLETAIDYSEIFPIEDEAILKKLKRDPYLKESLKLLAEMVYQEGIG